MQPQMCDLDLTFYLAVVALTSKNLSRLLSRYVVGTLVGGVGVQHHSVTLSLPLTLL